MRRSDITIIIPAYNEASTIGDVVAELLVTYTGAEIIVVNDGSTDDTESIARKAGATVINHPYNMGNGAAVKSGIRAATRDVLVFMDADRQHKTEDIEKLLQWLPQFDMVVGARSKSDHASLGRACANFVFNRMGSYVAKFNIKDLTSGFRVIKADLAKQFLYLLPNTYSYPTTLTLSVLRSGRSVKYVPVPVGKRTRGKSNIKAYRDGVRFLMIIIKICTLFSPLRVFLPVSVVVFCLGFFHYMRTLITAGRFTNMSALLFSTSLLIFLIGLVSEQICQMRFERSESPPSKG